MEDVRPRRTKLAELAEVPTWITNWCLDRDDLVGFSIRCRGLGDPYDSHVEVQLLWFGKKATKSFTFDHDLLARGQSGINGHLDALAVAAVGH